MFQGIESSQRVVERQSQHGQDDDANARAKIAAVDGHQKDGHNSPPLSRRPAAGARGAGCHPAVQWFLDGQQQRRQQDEVGNHLAEQALAGVQQQQAAGQPAQRRRGQQQKQSSPLAGKVGPLGQQRAQVAGAEGDGVGNVGGDGWHTQCGQCGKGDQRAAAGQRVDCSGGRGGQCDEDEINPF